MQNPGNHYFVYIVGDQQNSNVQVGIADDLQAMMDTEQHKPEQPQAEQKKLVYYEHYDQEEIALNRERQIKENSYDATKSLVNSMNPNWLDLSDTLSY